VKFALLARFDCHDSSVLNHIRPPPNGMMQQRQSPGLLKECGNTELSFSLLPFHLSTALYLGIEYTNFS
jgi:hypothetical protein